MRGAPSNRLAAGSPVCFRDPTGTVHIWGIFTAGLAPDAPPAARFKVMGRLTLSTPGVAAQLSVGEFTFGDYQAWGPPRDEAYNPSMVAGVKAQLTDKGAGSLRPVYIFSTEGIDAP